MSLWSWLFFLLLVGGLPLLSARSMARGRAASVTRAQLYLSVTLGLWAISGLGYLVVRADGQTLRDVFVRLPVTAAPSRSLALWSAAHAGAIGLLLAAPVVATGSILPAVLAHALIDAVGIAWVWPRLDRGWPGRPGAAHAMTRTGS